jgi:hypothetical protein
MTRMLASSRQIARATRFVPNTSSRASAPHSSPSCQLSSRVRPTSVVRSYHPTSASRLDLNLDLYRKLSISRSSINRKLSTSSRLSTPHSQDGNTTGSTPSNVPKSKSKSNMSADQPPSSQPVSTLSRAEIRRLPLFFAYIPDYVPSTQEGHSYDEVFKRRMSVRAEHLKRAMKEKEEGWHCECYSACSLVGVLARPRA